MSKKTPLSQGFIARVAAGVRYAFTGNADGWFDAGEPPAPAAQQAEGRRFDYEPFYNVGHSKPREREAVGFAQLRALADNYDVLRLVIEARKDQMECLKWTIQKRDVESTEDDESQRKDRKVDEAVAFFRSPDKEHTWADWLRILLEDLFVIDAPCIYPRKTLGGGLYALEVMDGATIKRVLDNTGRMPLPPDTAYQQILHGMAAVDYTADELIYRSRNNRSYKVYGYSPVEQIIMTVNIALKRQVHALEYYTAGSVPDALVGVPETWSADDIRRFQEYWDLLLSGETAQRRKMRFVPGELSRNFRETKQPPLKDVYDEWLARVVCFAFSVEPTPFVAQVNRSVAETSREQSLSDGMGSLKNWVKALIDDVLARYMDMAAYEFVWKGEESLNPKEQAEIYAIYKNAGILTADEIRAELGK
ncbi:TPA: phage portal protein, partial [Neisseria gonorrhoeae]